MSEVKQFYTYQQQIAELQTKGILCSEKDVELLVKHGYFNLVNGYREPFFSGFDNTNHHTYLPGTSLQQISYVKEFDDSLRILLLDAITKVEEELRTVSAYCFDLYNDSGNIRWHDKDAFSVKYSRYEVSKAITGIYKDLIHSSSEYATYYWSEYTDFPTWIVFKSINFSTFIKTLEYAKEDVNYAICNLYGISNANGNDRYRIFTGTLHWMRIIRNNCAHNERVYCLKPQGNKNSSMRIVEQYFSQLRKTYTKTGTPKTIFDLLVYLKYYYSPEDYEEFINHISDLLTQLSNKLLPGAFDKVRADMGIKNLADLEVLKTLPKTAPNYASLSKLTPPKTT